MQKFSLLYSSVVGVLGSSLSGVPERVVFRPIMFAFVGLGFHVGVWAVLVADLARSASLTPGRLGIALSVMTFAGIVALAFGGRMADLHGRRLFLLLGSGGTGVFFMTLAFISGQANFVHLLIALGIGGVCASSWDLAVNTLGSDYESRYRVRVMTFLHAGFSASAAAGSVFSGIMLHVGLDFRILYAAVGLALILLTLTLTKSRLPAYDSNISEAPAAGNSRVVVSGLLLTPVVLACLVMVFMSFSTDAVLEGFLSVYLRDVLFSGPLLAGFALASLYFSAAIGRLTSAIVLGILGERNVLALCGTASTVGMLCVVVSGNPFYSAASLLLVGMATSPVAPIIFSIAGRTVPGAGGRIIAITTISGYAAFTLSPLILGFVADITSLRASLLLPVAMSLSMVLVAMFSLPRKT